MITLGIDCGTQSTKCIALDCVSGGVIASASHPHSFLPGLPPGAMEQSPAEWTEAAAATIGSTLQQLGARKEEVRAVGVSGQQHGLVLLDGDGGVLRPAKLWCDTSTTAQCQTLTAALGGLEGAIEATGNAVLAGYTSPKLLWVKENEPEIWARVRRVLLPHDYLNFWLTGEATMEFGDASGTGLLDVRERRWSPRALAAIGGELAEWLPQPGRSTGIVGLVRGQLLSEWGLAQCVHVSAGGGDNMMAAIGTGNVQPGVFTVSLGTSGTIFAFSASPVVDPIGEIAAFCDSTDHWLPLACTMNVTLVTELTRSLFGWDIARFDREAEAVPPGSDGLFLLPYIAGERTPNLPGATGTWSGWNPQNFTPAHMARSAMEGVTFGLAYGLRRFRELGLAPSEIRLTGGGANSTLWRQMCADIFGVPTVRPRSSEGAALGAAIQCAHAWSREHGSDAALRDLTDRIVVLDESSRRLPEPSAAATYAAISQNLKAGCPAGSPAAG